MTGKSNTHDTETEVTLGDNVRLIEHFGPLPKGRGLTVVAVEKRYGELYAKCRFRDAPNADWIPVRLLGPAFDWTTDGGEE